MEMKCQQSSILDLLTVATDTSQTHSGADKQLFYQLFNRMVAGLGEVSVKDGGTESRPCDLDQKRRNIPIKKKIVESNKTVRLVRLTQYPPFLLTLAPPPLNTVHSVNRCATLAQSSPWVDTGSPTGREASAKQGLT
jgi:hypothetical protein